MLSQGYLLVESIAGISAEIAHLEAERLKLIALLHNSEFMRPLTAPPSAQAEAQRMHRPLRDLDRHDTTRAELVHRLHLRPYEARRLIDAALALTTRFPKTLHALSQGDLDLTRAQIIGEAGTPLADHHHTTALKAGFSPVDAETAATAIAELLEQHILKRAPTQTPNNLRDCLTRAVHRLDPDFADTTAKSNLLARQVTYRSNHGENTGDLYAHLGAAEGQGVYHVLDSYARAARYGGSKRRLNELRADALTHLVLNGHLPDNRHPADSTPTTRDTNTHDTNTTLIPQVDPNTGDIHHDPNDPHCPPPTEKLSYFTPRQTTPTPASTSASDPDHPTEATRSADTHHQRQPASPSNDTATASTATPASTATDSGGVTGTTSGSDAATSTNPPDTATTRETTSRISKSTPAQQSTRTKEPTSVGATTPNTAPHDPAPHDPAPHDPARAPAPAPAPAQISRSSLRAHVQVTVGMDTLLGLNDEPAELDGHGPITAATARDLAFAAGSTWRRLITDPVTGYLLDYGRKTYRPPTALADHIRARDVTCRTPNCTRPASKCDLDHIISWPAGATSDQNLAARCDIDHRLKHEGRWTHHLSTNPDHPPGTLIMTSPTGHTYLSHPHDYNDPWPERPTKPRTTRRNSSTQPVPPDDPGPPPF